MLGEHVVANVWRIDQGRVGAFCFAVFDVRDQSAAVQSVHVHDSVTDEVLRGIDGKSAHGDEHRKQR